MPRNESLLFDRDEVLARGEYELEHEHLYVEDPPRWFAEFFRLKDLGTHTLYNMARVVAEAVVMRFEKRLMVWVDKRIDDKILQHRADMHWGQR